MPTSTFAGTENAYRVLGHDTHVHDVPHLVFAVRGSVQLTVDDEPITLQRDEAVWMQANVPHSMRTDGDGMAIGPFLKPDAGPPIRSVFIGAVPAVIEIISAAMVVGVSTASEVAPVRDALCRSLRELTIPYFPRRMPWHPAVLRLAHESIRSPLSLQQLAAKHRMSARQVQRVFVGETGYSFARWRNQMRLNPAVGHLLGGGSVNEAMRIAGFATRAGLLRALSRETGIPTDELTENPQVLRNR